MQNEKDDNRRTRKEQTHNQTDRKKSRKKDAKKTRPDSPASDESDVDRKDPGQTRRKKTKCDPLAELLASEEFKADLRRPVRMPDLISPRIADCVFLAMKTSSTVSGR